MIATRKVRKMFKPILDTGDPALLDVSGVDHGEAMRIIRELSKIDAIRICDGPDAILSPYVITTRGMEFFRPRWWHHFI